MRLWLMRYREVARHVDVAKSHGFAGLVKGRRIQISLRGKDIRILHLVADKHDIWAVLQCTKQRLATHQSY